MSMRWDCVDGLLLCEAVASSSIRTVCVVEVVGGVGGVGVAVVAVAGPSESPSIFGGWQRLLSASDESSDEINRRSWTAGGQGRMDAGSQGELVSR